MQLKILDIISVQFPNYSDDNGKTNTIHVMQEQIQELKERVNAVLSKHANSDVEWLQSSIATSYRQHCRFTQLTAIISKHES